MTDKTKLYESLEKFIDAVASGDEEVQRDTMKAYISDKSKSILEFVGSNGIKLDGDDVLIRGKMVGQVSSDTSDMESGINFSSADGKFSREFNTIGELYSFLTDHFNVKEGVLALNEEDLDEASAEVKNAVGKQDAHKTARLARWSAVRNKKQPDGKPGDYDKGDEKDYVDPIKGGPDDAYSGHETDARNKKGYYDKNDPRPKHKDPIKGDSKPAYAGGASDLDTEGGYDSHDVRSKHNS